MAAIEYLDIVVGLACFCLWWKEELLHVLQNLVLFFFIPGILVLIVSASYMHGMRKQKSYGENNDRYFNTIVSQAFDWHRNDKRRWVVIVSFKP